MLDGNSWIRLVEGLTISTNGAKLRWERKSSATGDGGVAANLSRALVNSLNQAKIFSANAKNTMYEIASSDGYGGAPYELRVWEFEGTALRPIGKIRSSSNVTDADSFRLNESLRHLYVAVDESTESSDEIVDRLLREID